MNDKRDTIEELRKFNEELAQMEKATEGARVAEQAEAVAFQRFAIGLALICRDHEDVGVLADAAIAARVETLRQIVALSECGEFAEKMTGVIEQARKGLAALKGLGVIDDG